MDELLLVDNDRRIVDLAVWFLERRGFAVRSALSYREARVDIRERRPDLMLADLELGDENGREELPRLAAEGLLPRTLVVSGFLDAALDTELRALDAVVDTLAKPYDMDRLEECIRACLAMPIPGEPDASALPEVELVPQAPPNSAPRREAGDRHFEEAPAASADARDSASGSPTTTPEMSRPHDAPAPADEEDDDEWIEIAPRRRPEDLA